MSRYDLLDLPGESYFYIERSFDTADAFTEIYFGLDAVYEFMEEHGVPTDGNAITLHTAKPNGMMHLHIGFLVPRSHMHMAHGEVRAAFTPSGPIAHGTLIGPYEYMVQIYEGIDEFVQTEALTMANPTWQIYRNDMSMVHESKLITDCYAMVAA